MTRGKVKRLDLGFQIGDEVEVNADQAYPMYTQFVRRHPRFAARYQYRTYCINQYSALHVVGVFRHVSKDSQDPNKYVVVVEDQSQRIYLVGERGVKPLYSGYTCIKCHMSFSSAYPNYCDCPFCGGKNTLSKVGAAPIKIEPEVNQDECY